MWGDGQNGPKSWQIMGLPWFISQKSWQIIGLSWFISQKSWQIIGLSWFINVLWSNMVK
jgi:hypothetical protein